MGVMVQNRQRQRHQLPPAVHADKIRNGRRRRAPLVPGSPAFTLTQETGKRTVRAGKPFRDVYENNFAAVLTPF